MLWSRSLFAFISILSLTLFWLIAGLDSHCASMAELQEVPLSRYYDLHYNSNMPPFRFSILLPSNLALI